MVAAVLLMFVASLLVAPTAGAHTPYCGIRWGSLPKGTTGAVMEQGTLRNVRTGQHRCFDRVVIDVNGPITGYSVKYVDPNLMEAPVPLRGGARLQAVVHLDYGAPPTYTPARPLDLYDLSGYRTLRQVAVEGAQSPVGIGVRARLPFRVFTLVGPGDGSRLVIDVGHRWY